MLWRLFRAPPISSSKAATAEYSPPPTPTPPGGHTAADVVQHGQGIEHHRVLRGGHQRRLCQLDSADRSRRCPGQRAEFGHVWSSRSVPSNGKWDSEETGFPGRSIPSERGRAFGCGRATIAAASAVASATAQTPAPNWTSSRGNWSGDQQSFVFPINIFHGGIPGGDDCGPAGRRQAAAISSPARPGYGKRSAGPMPPCRLRPGT